MTAGGSFERDLQNWLAAEAPAAAPAGLHAAVIDRARTTRQRRRLLPIRGGDFVPGASTVRPAVTLAWLLVLIAFLAAIFLAAVAAGAFRSDPRSPLGRNGAIAYEVRDISSRPYNHGHLVNPDGTGDRVIGQATCPTFSRDGSVLTYQAGWADTAQITIAAADGSAPRVMPGLGEVEYALSPDGTQIAWFKRLQPITSPDGNTTVGAKQELWITPVTGSPGVRIVPAPDGANEWNSFPVWSPDGRQLAFARNLTVSSADGSNTGSYRIAFFVVDADGSNMHRLTARPGTDGIGLSWSPDGRSVAYLGLPDRSPLPSLGPGSGPPDAFALPQDVFVIGADGSGDRNLTNSPSDDEAPNWSPDGAFVAYETFEGGSGYLLATIPMQGPNEIGPRRLGPVSDRFVWSPDGGRLLTLHVDVTNASAGTQTFRTTMATVDAQFRQPPVTLVTVDLNIGCAPSWQRLEP